MAPSRNQLTMVRDNFLRAANEFTAESMLALCTPTCIYTVAPSSLGVAPRDLAGYSEFMQQISKVLHNFSMTLIESLVDTESSKILLRAKSSADTAIGPYANEYCFILAVDEDGERIKSIVEFADSGYSEKFFDKLKG